MTQHNTPDIAMKPVTSSQIAEVGHCPVSNTLAVRFRSKTGTGSLYHYPGVTAEQYQEFCAAPSLGKHFGQHIKGNERHPHRKIA